MNGIAKQQEVFKQYRLTLYRAYGVDLYRVEPEDSEFIEGYTLAKIICRGDYGECFYQLAHVKARYGGIIEHEKGGISKLTIVC